MNFDVGIIGTGSIAEGGHAPAVTFSSQTELVAILSRDKERGYSFLKEQQVSTASIF